MGEGVEVKGEGVERGREREDGKVRGKRGKGEGREAKEKVKIGK